MNSGESTTNMAKGLNASTNQDLDKLNGHRIRSKSRGKAANTTTRSKERIKLRSTVVDITSATNIEELI